MELEEDRMGFYREGLVRFLAIFRFKNWDIGGPCEWVSPLGGKIGGASTSWQRNMEGRICLKSVETHKKLKIYIYIKFGSICHLAVWLVVNSLSEQIIHACRSEASISLVCQNSNEIVHMILRVFVIFHSLLNLNWGGLKIVLITMYLSLTTQCRICNKVQLTLVQF